MGTVTFVELCVGSAAVALRWLSATAASPLAYQGSKRMFADPILSALRMEPGGASVRDRVILVEPGPWGEAWALWRTLAGRRDTCEKLRVWTEEEPQALWDRLTAAPVPADLGDRVAAWAVLSHWNYARKPVFGNGRWITHGFNRVEVYAAEYAKSYVAPDGRTWARKNRRLPDIVQALEALPDLSHVEVLVTDARTVEPISGATVYIDPDYQNTIGYGHTFPRADVLTVAEKWRRAGCRVAVSEAEPLQFGWNCHVRLPPPRGRGRTFSKQQEEWLTVSECAL